MRRVNYINFQGKTGVPYVGPIGSELIPRLEIEILGSIAQYATRFAINLQCGPNVTPRDDVALHLGVDFTRKVVIRNNILMNSWGPEENVGSFPFYNGQNTRICIQYHSDAFKIRVDDREICSFLHRIPPNRVSHLAIDGEFNLTSIEVRVQDGGYPGGGAPYPTDIGFNPNYSNPPYPVNSQPPFPTPSLYPGNASGPYPGYAGPAPPYPSGRTSPYTTGGVNPYPVQPGLAPGGYPTQPPSYHPPSPNMSYGNAPYPQQPGMQGVHYPSSPGHQKHKGNNILNSAGAVVGTMAAGGLVGGLMKKGAKKMSKKKALKYGLPIAGVGLGAYALNKTFRRSSSSSSSSSGSWSS